VGEAQAQKAQLNETRESLRQQLKLAVLTARDNLATAQQSVTAAHARQSAAEEAFRIAANKRDAGALTQVEFFDAERAQTESRLGLAIASLQLRSSQAELEYATASYPLPGDLFAPPATQEVAP
jgi:outer membrane protein TolC